MKKIKLKSIALFEIFLMISLIFVISILNSNLVYSEVAVDNRVCCQKTKVNNVISYCQYTNPNNCDISDGGLVFPSPCEEVSVCKPVCCNVNNLGYYASGGQGCYKSVSLDTCVNDLRGQPIQDASCNAPECNKGCCVIGSQCAITTNIACTNLTNNYPSLTLDYRTEVTNEIECQNVCRSATKGCCVTPDLTDGNNKGCNLNTFAECSSGGGEFYDNTDCVDLPNNNTDCDRCKDTTDNPKTGCAVNLDGGDNVYEYDKCGNPRMNRIIQQCDYGLGTICKDDDKTNSASCASLNCNASVLYDNPFVDENGDCCTNRSTETGACLGMKPITDNCWNNDNKTNTDFNVGNSRTRNYRYNGESWCQYEADAGPTRDLPGTRHYVHTCVEGQEKVQECTDVRDQFCRQVNDPEGFSVAACVPNRAVTNICSDATDKKTCEDTTLRDCVWLAADVPTIIEDLKNIELQQCQKIKQNNATATCPASKVDETQALFLKTDQGKCIPLVPPATKNNPAFCDAGSISNLTSYWSHSVWGDAWDCDVNCNIYTNEFAYQQNLYCGSLGDCGAKYNLAGKWSDAGFIRSCNTQLQTDDSDLEGVENAKDFGEEYSGGDAADKLLSDCNEQLLEPGNYTKSKPKKAESFVNFSNYKNSLMINLPPGTVSYGYTNWAAIGSAIGLGAIVIAGGIFIAAAESVVLVGAGTTFVSFSSAPLIAASILNIGGVLAVAFLVSFLIWGSDSAEEIVSVECKPWAPPTGGDNCNLCYEPGTRTYVLPNGSSKTESVDFTAGGNHDCTQYLCESLGSACQYKETNDGPRCLNDCASELDVHPPTISLWSNLSLANNQSCRESNQPADGNEVACSAINTGSGYKINYVKENTDLIVGVETNILSTCRWDWKKSNPPTFDALEKVFDQSLASKVHTITLKAEQDLNAEDKKTMNIMCQDICGNPRGDQPYKYYTIDLEVSKAKDIGAPVFSKIEPSDGSSTKWDFNFTNVKLFLNEKADCRWDRTNNPFDAMNVTNEFRCNIPVQGCSFIIDGLEKGSNVFYLRCKDKDGNKNIDALPSNNGYTLIKSDQLNISSYTCTSNFGNGCDVIYDNNFTLELNTIGGGYQGRAICQYNFGNWVNFFETNSTTHKQVIGPRPTGNYSDLIKCFDDAGNDASITLNYSMIRDNDPPKILKLTLDGNVLNVLTDEISACKYADNSSVFYDFMTDFDLNSNTIHSASFGDRNYLHVKCKDRFGHVSSLDVYKRSLSGPT